MVAMSGHGGLHIINVDLVHNNAIHKVVGIRSSVSPGRPQKRGEDPIRWQGRNIAASLGSVNAARDAGDLPEGAGTLDGVKKTL
jgi:hypothetical protein